MKFRHSGEFPIHTVPPPNGEGICFEFFARISGTEKRFFHGASAFYDARVILAFACLAFMNRKIIPNTNAERILGILKKTSYSDVPISQGHNRESPFY
nr:MAG TPA: hypothetical protein [Caudoviricetes sp.]